LECPKPARSLPLVKSGKYQSQCKKSSELINSILHVPRKYLDNLNKLVHSTFTRKQRLINCKNKSQLSVTSLKKIISNTKRTKVRNGGKLNYLAKKELSKNTSSRPYIN
jgi:hypothetical protein